MQPKLDKKQLKIGRMQPFNKLKLRHERRELYMNFSDNLKKIRKEHNLSQEQIAEQLGVSRQSVSKWESGQAYPEMDKMLQLCKLFNLNIDELLNQDIKEVNNTKQAKNNINKFIDDFLDYITKTIDMFSSMKFKQKIKCMLEQIIIASFLTIILLIIGTILSSIFSSLFSFVPRTIYYPIYRIVESLYLIFCLILSITLILHIFKVRYLDYYIIIKENQNPKDSNMSTDTNIETQSKTTSEESTHQKILLEKRKEQIIIRDPNHSGYKFISGLLKCLLFFIKALSLIPVIFLCLFLVFFIVCLVLSFLILNTGYLFVGILLILISSIIIILVTIIIIYNFIVSKKNQKTILATSFIVSLILLGIGIGFTAIGTLNFNVINDLNSNYYTKKEYTLELTDGLCFDDYYGRINYIESENENIKIEIKYSELFITDMYSNHDNTYYFEHYIKEESFMPTIRQIIKDINNKKFIDYSNHDISIFTTKENIKILKQNLYNNYIR